MNIEFTSRKLSSNELRLLKTLQTKTEKAIASQAKLSYYLIALIIALGCTYICTIIPDSFWTFLLGTIAVIAVAFIIFTPYEYYKQRKHQRSFLNKLNLMLHKGVVQTCQIHAKRIALAPEYEDESDLYIIELNDQEVLYIWDLAYKLSKKFPCLAFEIYEEDFFELTERQIYPLSEKIPPEQIDRKAKWNYLSKFGVMGHLEKEHINFDRLLEKFQKCA